MHYKAPEPALCAALLMRLPCRLNDFNFRSWQGAATKSKALFVTAMLCSIYDTRMLGVEQLALSKCMMKLKGACCRFLLVLGGGPSALSECRLTIGSQTLAS